MISWAKPRSSDREDRPVPTEFIVAIPLNGGRDSIAGDHSRTNSMKGM